MVGRQNEGHRLQILLDSNRSEFLAVTGRRRVGKTYLVDHLLSSYYAFQITGIRDGDMQTQLINFDLKLRQYSGADQSRTTSWQFAFEKLKQLLKAQPDTNKQVLFFDEVPWLATARSGFIQHLAHFWNDFLSKHNHFLLVICGSATSWITQKIVNDRGGLHNRLTEVIHLTPFSLSEVQVFLNNRKIDLTPQLLTQYYMTLGGIPYYLEQIRRGESYAQTIERICFDPGGILHREYLNLYQALFNNADLHEQIVALLAQHKYGLTRLMLSRELGVEASHGSFRRALKELIASDFLVEYSAYGKSKRDKRYVLCDEYSIFYHHFQKNLQYTTGIWQQLSTSQAYKSWSGLAFERLCTKHISEIKAALGISAVYTEQYTLSERATDLHPGFQIDLLIDRKDQVINLCEIKHHQGPFAINKEYHSKLIQRRAAFIEHSKTAKQVYLTMITSQGLHENKYSREIDAQLTVEDLLR